MSWIFVRDLGVSVSAFVLLFGSYLGFGWGAGHVMGLRLGGRSGLFAYFWLGWAATLLVLQLLHLFLPISALVAIPLLAVGLALLIPFWREIRGAAVWRPSLVYALGVAALAVVLAVRGMPAPELGDTGLYHANTIRWLNEYPIVAGLGNLHGRLAFNQTFFVYVAELNLFPVFRHGHNLAISMLLLAALAECLAPVGAVLRGLKGEGPILPQDVTIVLVAPILIWMGLTGWISSPAPDYAATILQVILFVHCATRLLSSGPREHGRGYTQYLLVMSASLITLKATNAAYALTMMCVLLFLQMRAGAMTGTHWLAQLARGLAVPAAIIGIWAFRGVILSGCPAYPLSIGCMPLEWAVPIESVRHEAAWAYSWARDPGPPPEQVLSSWAWLAPWFERIAAQEITIVRPLAAGLAAIVAAGVLAAVRGWRRAEMESAWLLPIVPAAAILAWFFTAPDPRFAAGFFWTFQMAGLAVLLRAIGPARKAGRVVALLGILILSAGMLTATARHAARPGAVLQSGYGPIPQASLTRETTLHGLKVFMPEEGDRCWDAPLPCTPYFYARLKLVQRGIWPEFLLVDPE